MSTATQTVQYTPEDLLKLPDARDHRYELEDGQLVEKDMSMLASWVAARCGRLLGNFCDQHPRGWVLESDNTYQCFPKKPGRVRRPDVSFIEAGRVSREQLEEGHVRVSPDLLAETVSPNDVYYEVLRRVSEFLDAGVRLIWIINPDDQTVQVYRRDGSSSRLTADQELSGEDVLPGFQCQVRDLFPPPELLATLTESSK